MKAEHLAKELIEQFGKEDAVRFVSGMIIIHMEYQIDWRYYNQVFKQLKEL